jgi:hypothetical protein
VRAAVDRFGRIDVLVNNAGTFYAGYFEELAPEQIERQLATNLIGPISVARAVLPVMREHRSGHIVSISSGAGLVGFEFCSAYARRSSAWRAGWSRLGPRSRRPDQLELEMPALLGKLGGLLAEVAAERLTPARSARCRRRSPRPW